MDEVRRRPHRSGNCREDEDLSRSCVALSRIFASGSSFDETIGLIETIDKNAHVYVSVGGNIKQCITDEQVHELADHFGLETAF